MELRNIQICEPDQIDESIQRNRNEYATKMLILFFPFRNKSDFPVFDERWIFFSQAMDNEQLYIDASRIMQNIQDVENSKKIGVIPDGIEKSTASFANSEFNLPEYDDDHLDGSDDDQQNDENIGNEFDLIMEEYENHQRLWNEKLDQSNCGIYSTT